MAKILLFAYAGAAVCFLRAYLPRPTLAGVLASLLWPITLMLGLAWLIMLGDDHVAGQASAQTRAASPGQHVATGRGPLVTVDHTGMG
jgi:hypothetical protein